MLPDDILKEKNIFYHNFKQNFFNLTFCFHSLWSRRALLIHCLLEIFYALKNKTKKISTLVHRHFLNYNFFHQLVKPFPFSVFFLFCRFVFAYFLVKMNIFTQNYYWKLGIRERNTSRLHIVTLLIYIICRVHHEKCQAGWSTS